MKTLFGGSDTKSQQTSQSGFSQLPQELQDAWKNLGTQATSVLGNPTTAATMFTNPTLNTGAQNALSQIGNQAFAPTAANVQASMDMQTNPYDQSVIDTINKQAAGQNSALSSYLTNAGQFGSNRGALSANDIDLSRLNQIGTFKNNEFQTAMNNALTTIPQAGMASAQGALNGGLLTQQQMQQNQLAPVSALQALAQVTGVMPSNGGSIGQQTGSSNQQNGIFKSIALTPGS